MISVLVLTLNEARDLPGCLDSVAWCDDIHVFDSCSTDATVALARERGACVIQRPFDDYASQRNAALQQSCFRHPWVLVLDADERASGGLRRAVTDFVASPQAEGYAAARVRRRDYLYGTWLRHVQASPYYVRLLRPSRCHYRRAVNEVVDVDGAIFGLEGHIEHYPFSKGIAHWVAKHNRYSDMEALEVLRNWSRGTAFSWQKLFSRDFHERRRHQKALFYRLPARPWLKFLALYLFKGGFLDGRAGFTYAALQGFYEYLIVLKTREELARRASGRT